jgi:hypothetical protein
LRSGSQHGYTMFYLDARIASSATARSQYGTQGQNHDGQHYRKARHLSQPSAYRLHPNQRQQEASQCHWRQRSTLNGLPIARRLAVAVLGVERNRRYRNYCRNRRRREDRSCTRCKTGCAQGQPSAKGRSAHRCKRQGKGTVKLVVAVASV